MSRAENMFAHQLIKKGLSRFPMTVGKMQIIDQYNQGEMQKYNHGETQTSSTRDSLNILSRISE